MAVSVKNKIRWGTVFLFFLVVSSGGVGIYYLVKLRLQTNNILTANYESLQYAHHMQKALDSVLEGNVQYQDTINHYLQKQESNITERGEGEATKHLRKAFELVKRGDTVQIADIRRHLQTILSLNMQAIQSKSETSEAASEQAVIIIITAVAIILIIGFTFVVNFPSVVTEPINKLTEGIGAISRKNYHHRIHIQSKDEFGKLADSFNDMAERLEYFESSNLNKIIFEKSRAEAVINSLKDASLGIDKNEVVLFANNQALQLLGVSAKEVVGAKVEDFAKRNDLFRFLIEEKSSTPFKVLVEHKENYFTKETLHISQEGSSSRVIVLKNITSFKELDVAKTNFISTVSHELKTPLASSDFSLKLLGDERIGKLSSEQKELLQSLKDDNQRMLRILSELLNMSQVEAGKIQLNIQKVDTEQVVHTSVNTVLSAAKEKGITIEIKVEADLPAINADADKLTWVLNNFLTNAIKYSPSQSVVSIKVKNVERCLSFSVQDQGQGIDEAYLSRIFERYFQVPGRSDKKGSGIGLAICKEFIEAMGGTVWVKSKIGDGSTFGFDLSE